MLSDIEAIISTLPRKFFLVDGRDICMSDSEMKFHMCARFFRYDGGYALINYSEGLMDEFREHIKDVTFFHGLKENNVPLRRISTLTTATVIADFTFAGFPTPSWLKKHYPTEALRHAMGMESTLDGYKWCVIGGDVYHGENFLDRRGRIKIVRDHVYFEEESDAMKAMLEEDDAELFELHKDVL